MVIVAYAARRVAEAAILTALLGSTAMAASIGTDSTPLGGGGFQGASSSSTPYLLPTNPTNWNSVSLLTVGDSVNNKPNSGDPYRMVGIPDGLGAFDNGNGTITVLMNHELGATQGATRAHGATGAFVSKWVIEKNSLKVLSGSDLIQQVATFNTGTGSFDTPAQGAALTIGRLCSADLPAISALYNVATGLGYNGRLFMNGEEVGTNGRAFATEVSTGIAYELPALGKFSWENSLANPGSGNKTVVIGTDDATGGQVYLYVGDKKAAGNAVEKAGLTGGNLYGIAISGVTTETNATGIAPGTAFTLKSLGDVTNKTGAQIETDSVAAGATAFLRPEDGAWDPTNPKVFYFVTTNAFDNPTRLWKLEFDDINNPEAGGKISMLIDGAVNGVTLQMLDNMTVGTDGKIYLQEDVGNNAHLGRIFVFDPNTGELTEIFEHDPALFLSGEPGFLTQDEEGSGIIDVTHLFTDAVWFDAADVQRVLLSDVQAHFNLPGELVQGGQLLLLAQVPEPATLALFGLGLAGLGAMRRRR